MRSQVGYVQVVVPPDIVVEESSTDLITTEGSNVTLRCKAKGMPPPKISWKREDQTAITVQNSNQSGQQNKYIGNYSILNLKKNKIIKPSYGLRNTEYS